MIALRTFIGFSLFFIGSASCGVFSSSKTQEKQITFRQLKELRAEGAVVVDVRTTAEFEKGCIPGAIHMDFFETGFVGKVSDIGRNKKIILYCASGNRSEKAQKRLVEAGLGDIWNYSGGYSDWISNHQIIERSSHE